MHSRQTGILGVVVIMWPQQVLSWKPLSLSHSLPLSLSHSRTQCDITIKQINVSISIRQMIDVSRELCFYHWSAGALDGRVVSC